MMCGQRSTPDGLLTAVTYRANSIDIIINNKQRNQLIFLKGLNFDDTVTTLSTNNSLCTVSMFKQK